eukprot:COSAG01_NODE_23_length_37704_cov_30.005877_51_plen_55_part_00
MKYLHRGSSCVALVVRVPASFPTEVRGVTTAAEYCYPQEWQRSGSPATRDRVVG